MCFVCVRPIDFGPGLQAFRRITWGGISRGHTTRGFHLFCFDPGRKKIKVTHANSYSSLGSSVHTHTLTYFWPSFHDVQEGKPTSACLPDFGMPSLCLLQTSKKVKVLLAHGEQPAVANRVEMLLACFRLSFWGGSYLCVWSGDAYLRSAELPLEARLVEVRFRHKDETLDGDEHLVVERSRQGKSERANLTHKQTSAP